MNDDLAVASPAMVYPDVISLLKADHRKVEALFAEFSAQKNQIPVHEKFEIVRKVCGELLIHMAIEEGIFYPAAREAIRDAALMDEASVEHESAKDLIIQLGNIQPDDPIFDAKVQVLADQIEHHVQEEESLMFPKVLVSEIDLIAIGKELLEAKNNMRARLGLPVEEVADDPYSQNSFYFSSPTEPASSASRTT